MLLGRSRIRSLRNPKTWREIAIIGNRFPNLLFMRYLLDIDINLGIFLIPYLALLSTPMIIGIVRTT